MRALFILVTCLMFCQGTHADDDDKWSSFLRELQRALESSEKTVVQNKIRPTQSLGDHDGKNNTQPSYNYTQMSMLTVKPTATYPTTYTTYPSNSSGSSSAYMPQPPDVNGANTTSGIKPSPGSTKNNDNGTKHEIMGAFGPLRLSTIEGPDGCSFLKEMIRKKMTGFPSLQGESSKMSIPMDHFQSAIQQAISAYRVIPNARLVSMDLTEKIADTILQQRLHCTTFKFQKVIYNLLANGVSTMMTGAEGDLLLSLTTMMMQLGLEPADKWAAQIITILHGRLFNFTMDQLLHLELQDLHSFVKTLDAHLRQALKSQKQGNQLQHILEEDLKSHSTVLKCTTPDKMRSMHVMVVMSLLKRFGLLAKGEAVTVMEGIMGRVLQHETPLKAEFVKMLSTYIRPVTDGIRQYEQSLMFGSFRDSMEFLQSHLDKDQLRVAETLLEHMGWSGQTFQPVLASYLMRPVSNYMEEAIESAETMVKDVKVFNGSVEELKTFIIRSLASWIVANQGKIDEIRKDYMMEEPSM